MKHKPLWLKWIYCLTPAVLGLVMYFLLPLFPKFTEYAITRGVFRLFAFPLEWLISLIPFSVTETIVVLAAPVILTLIIIWLIKIIRSPNKKQTFERGIRFSSWFFSLFLLIFMIMDGGNFSRVPLGELMELPNKKYTAEELYIVTCDLAKKASEVRENLPEDENGCYMLTMEKDKLLKLADDVYDNLQKEYPYLITGTTRVKSVALSHLWSYTGTTGVYCPWTGEANVNTDVPDSELGHTVAHEIAHTMGFAKENECNFLGWLACATSSMPDYEYSGYMSAYVYSSNALYKADKSLWRSASGNLSQKVKNDLAANSKYWLSFKGDVMKSSQTVNDKFIKVNGVKSGVLSYNEMVGLMLGYYDKQGLLE